MQLIYKADLNKRLGDLPINNITTDLKLIYDKKIIDMWSNKKWPYDMLSEVEWLVKKQAEKNNDYFHQSNNAISQDPSVQARIFFEHLDSIFGIPV